MRTRRFVSGADRRAVSSEDERGNPVDRDRPRRGDRWPVDARQAKFPLHRRKPEEAFTRGSPAPPDRPLPVDRVARGVATADGDVRTTLDPGQQPCGIRGIVRKVGVHLHDHARAERFQRVAHPPHVSLSETASRTDEQTNASIRPSASPDQVRGAVGTVVINQQEDGVRAPVQFGQAP